MNLENTDWKKPDTDATHCIIPFIQNVTNRQTHANRKQVSVVRCWGGVTQGLITLRGWGVLLQGNEKLLKLESSGGYKNCNCTKCH